MNRRSATNTLRGMLLATWAMGCASREPMPSAVGLRRGTSEDARGVASGVPSPRATESRLAVAETQTESVSPVLPVRRAFADRIREAMAARRSESVEYVDVLGEGTGAWDSAPREVRDGRTNCLVWVQTVLADAYGQGDAARRSRFLDALRYYGASPAFGMRKHYADQWVASEPGPLRPIQEGRCAGTASVSLRLTPRVLARRNGYGCPLYREEQRRIEVSYLPTDAAMACAPRLGAGVHVGMAVATPRYLQRFGSASGPMGLVHALLVEVDAEGRATVHHASITAGAVLSESFAAYADRTRSVYRGFAFFSLDPDWEPAPPRFDAEAERVLACERDLVAAGRHRDAQRDFEKRPHARPR